MARVLTLVPTEWPTLTSRCVLFCFELSRSSNSAERTVERTDIRTDEQANVQGLCTWFESLDLRPYGKLG